jgi:uncharacterized membrane protein affecting hemolysin expression
MTWELLLVLLLIGVVGGILLAYRRTKRPGGQ